MIHLISPYLAGSMNGSKISKKRPTDISLIQWFDIYQDARIFTSFATASGVASLGLYWPDGTINHVIEFFLVGPDGREQLHHPRSQS
jgi:hypothetical protein